MCSYTSQATLEDGSVPAEMTIAIRTASDGQQVGATLRRIVQELGPGKAGRRNPGNARHHPLAGYSSTPAFNDLSGSRLFAGVALALGMVGVYGVLAFLVSKRARDGNPYGVSGAQRSDVLLLVMKKKVGSSASLGSHSVWREPLVVTRLLASQLYGVGPMDPATFTGVAIWQWQSSPWQRALYPCTPRHARRSFGGFEI